MAGAERKKPTHLAPWQWKPGESGNIAGRAVGSRNKLSEQFLAALQSDFEKHGVAAIAAVREKRPQDYLKMVASLLPRTASVDIAVGPSQELQVALAEFSQDYAAVRSALERIGADPVILDAVALDDE